MTTNELMTYLQSQNAENKPIVIEATECWNTKFVSIDEASINIMEDIIIVKI